MGETTYRNLKIYHLLRKSRHLIVKAEPVLANGLSGEDEIALPLLLPVDNYLLTRADDRVIDVEGAARLYLQGISYRIQRQST